MLKTYWLGIAVLLIACQSNTKKNEPSPKDSIVKDSPKEIKATSNNKIPVDAQWNRMCLLLSGNAKEIDAIQTNQEIWKNYANQSNEKWNVLNQRIAKPISNWTNQKNYENKSCKTLLYPFAGGDFFYAHLFFPNVDTTIMIGLEPPGYLFNPDTCSATNLNNYLNNLEKSLFYPHKLGFFRTLSMETDFQKGLLNGTIHTCLYYLSKFGNNVHYIKAFNIDENGNISNEVNLGNKAHFKKGFRIGYSSPADNQVKELIYYTANLSNSGLQTETGEKHNGLAKYLDAKRNTVSFFKAASYLMYNSYFSTIRNISLNHSKVILQDDSGMPLSALKDGGFEVELLGNYTRTIGLFRHRFQPKMKVMYDSLSPQKLPFTIGYNAEFGECNLQLARKK